MIKKVLFIVAALLLSASSVEARQHHRSIVTAVDPNCNILWPCEGVTVSPRGQRVVKAMSGFGTATKIYKREAKINYRDNVNEPRRIRKQPRTIAVENVQPTFTRSAVSREAQVIGGRPSGCPHAYCGCSASLRLFGKIVPGLNLAANWGRFPSAAPAPGMAAYRNHHVFVIEAVNADGTVVAHDGNSGRGLTRIHTVSLRGYRVVNPHA